jgi:hypothetical protein
MGLQMNISILVRLSTYIRPFLCCSHTTNKITRRLLSIPLLRWLSSAVTVIIDPPIISHCTEHPLADDFQLSIGKMRVQVPDIEPRDDYIVVRAYFSSCHFASSVAQPTVR